MHIAIRMDTKPAKTNRVLAFNWYEKCEIGFGVPKRSVVFALQRWAHGAIDDVILIN